MPSNFALTELLGAPVFDSTGARTGRVREVALCPQDDRVRVAALIVRTSQGDRLLSGLDLSRVNGGIQATTAQPDWPVYASHEGLLLLGRDLLDQQIIDVHGRKVVRVNDVDIHEENADHKTILKVGAVDVGARGAVRRLLKGVAPASAIHKLLSRIPERAIPWDFVDMIETDPARRVKLKISLERLGSMHPADIADIVEDLTPAEREAVFETLDEEVAAEALEEITPKVRQSIIQSLDSDRAADIVEEMDPDAAADLLADLAPEHSEEILGEMEPEERKDVEELLEFREDTAAGRMTTEYLAINPDATVEDAIGLLRNFEGGVETVNTIFLIDADEKLVGSVPLANLVLAAPGTHLSELVSHPLISVHVGARENEFSEIFDKYNLLTLPVIDDEGRLTGVITADDVITLLRSKL